MNLKRLLVYTPLLLLASLATAQVPVTVAPIPQFQAFDQSGRPLAFGCVFTYQSGTTTPLATYSDYTGLIANANPVALSASGSANIWIQSGQIYTFVVESAGGTDCSTGTVMYSVDGIGSGAPQTVTTVASSTTPSFSVIAQIQLFKITLTASATALPVSFVNVQAPAIITFQITQDATGGRTFTWPSNVTGGVTVDSAANHTTTQTFVWNGSTILPVGSGFTSTGNTLLAGSTTGAALSGTSITSPIFSSNSANVAASGIFRLSSTDSSCWRNNANNADLCLSHTSADALLWPSTAVSLGPSTTTTVNIQPQATSAGNGSALWLRGGNSTAASTNGGGVTVIAADGVATDGSGANVLVEAGTGQGSGTGGGVNLDGGNALGSANAGNVVVTAGSASGIGNGGNVTLIPGTSSSGTGGTIILNGTGRSVPTTFANLPACSGGTMGDFRVITDGSVNTWGSTVAGSGVNVVLAFCDGTNWTVAAK